MFIMGQQHLLHKDINKLASEGLIKMTKSDFIGADDSIKWLSLAFSEWTNQGQFTAGAFRRAKNFIQVYDQASILKSDKIKANGRSAR